jgi:hypothetical protein
MSNEGLHDVICPFCKTVALQMTMLTLDMLTEKTEQDCRQSCSCGKQFLISKVNYRSLTEASETILSNKLSAVYIIAKDWDELEEIEELAKLERVGCE